jgi:hypothetical protein
MSLVQLAHNKDAVNFQKALTERLEAKVGQVLAETKIEIASTLLENPNGITSSAGGVKTKAEGGMVGKDRLPDTTDIKSSEGIAPPGGTHISGVTKKPSPHEKGGRSVPGDNSTFDAKMPGKTNEETAPKPEPLEQKSAGKGKRALRMMMKKKYDKKQHDESVQVIPHGEVNEKIISPGTVEHMSHAVHACATGHCPAVSHRGTFTHYEHPHYSIHKDHGGIHPDKAEHHYYVAGAGGMHQFSVHHSSKGVDVKHVKQVS